jgi:sirohydrochlorin cobaltochelatase
MKIPIVMAAFGTTTRALATYEYIDKSVWERFPDHEITWSYSSRMVKDWIKKRKNIDLKHPHEVLQELHEKGHEWAIVQSMHFLAGHEFYRLLAETDQALIRTSIGLPLLSSPEDYLSVINVLRPVVEAHPGEAIVLVGHGTDHPIWSSYLALHHMLREEIGSQIYVGVVEEYPGQDAIVDHVRQAGFKKVCLVPFMLVAGVHFEEDLIGENKDSWKSVFQNQGITVSIEGEGLGLYPGISDIFCDHIEAALTVIPGNFHHEFGKSN